MNEAITLKWSSLLKCTSWSSDSSWTGCLYHKRKYSNSIISCFIALKVVAHKHTSAITTVSCTWFRMKRFPYISRLICVWSCLCWCINFFFKNQVTLPSDSNNSHSHTYLIISFLIKLFVLIASYSSCIYNQCITVICDTYTRVWMIWCWIWLQNNATSKRIKIYTEKDQWY